jgi:hypothetical protein
MSDIPADLRYSPDHLWFAPVLAAAWCASG